MRGDARWGSTSAGIFTDLRLNASRLHGAQLKTGFISSAFCVC